MRVKSSLQTFSQRQLLLLRALAAKLALRQFTLAAVYFETLAILQRARITETQAETTTATATEEYPVKSNRIGNELIFVV